MSDHLDTYENLDAITAAFVDFATPSVPFFGQVILCLDDRERAQRLLPRLKEGRPPWY